jgi:hypothetical protein
LKETFHKSTIRLKTVELYSVAFKYRTCKVKRNEVISILIIKPLKRCFKPIYIKASFGILINKASELVTEFIELSYDLNSIPELTIKVTNPVAIPSTFYIFFEIFVCTVVSYARGDSRLIIRIAKNKVTTRASIEEYFIIRILFFILITTPFFFL